MIGQGDLALNQWQAQMALWAMYDSSMFVSCDLPNIQAEVKLAMLLAGLLNVDDDTLDQRPTHLVKVHKRLCDFNVCTCVFLWTCTQTDFLPCLTGTEDSVLPIT